MKIRPLAAFAGAAALAAVAFAPAVTSTSDVTGVARDGKAAALATGDLDLGDLTTNNFDVGDITASGVPFGVTVPCTAGFAGPYECENVDLASHVPLAELGGGAGSDSWGWLDDRDNDDPSDDRYIAIHTTTFGAAYVDITDPNIPVVIGRTTITPGGGILWRDVKVHDDHAYFVSEEGGTGVIVVDLETLPNWTTINASPANRVGPSALREVPPVNTYEGNGNSHNIWINEDTARAYVVGTDQSSAGLHILDLSDPANPVYAGEFAADGYTHDVECVIYTGPDADYNGNYAGPDMDGDATNGSQAELCFAANEDSMTIVDVSDPAATRQVAKINYQTASYTHQGVLTDDMQWLLWNDETDEGATGPGTRTYWADISDLDLEMWQDGIVAPGPVNDGVCVYTHDLLTVDHNMYITGDILWQANYNGGIQIFQIDDEGLANCEMERIGFFDVDPGLNVGAYGGAWNVFPHFGQDKIVVSTLDEGLYVLQTDFEVGQS